MRYYFRVGDWIQHGTVIPKEVLFKDGYTYKEYIIKEPSLTKAVSKGLELAEKDGFDLSVTIYAVQDEYGEVY